MSIKIKRTIILKINPKEYELLMYLRQNEIDLTRFKPGNVSFHYNDQNLIKKYEMHIYGIPQEIPVDNLII